MRNLLVLLVLVLSLSYGVKSFAQDSLCDGLGAPAAGLCKAYCDVLQCNVSDSTGCEHLLITYVNLTGYGPPCDPICSEEDISTCGGHAEVCPDGQIKCTREYKNGICLGSLCSSGLN